MDAIGTSLVFAQAVGAAEKVEAVKATGAPLWVVALLCFVVFVLPFVLGGALAQALRLKDLSFRISLVLFSIFFALTPFVYNSLIGRSWTDAIRLGIDLAGGTNLVYAVDQEEAKSAGKTVDKNTLDKMVLAIIKRINPGGAEEVTVRRVGNDRIEIIIPGADRDLVEQKKRAMTRLGSLEFARLANQKDDAQLIAEGEKLPPDVDEIRREGAVIAAWKTLAPGAQAGGNMTASREVERANKLTGEVSKVQQMLVVLDPPKRAVTGFYLTQAASDMDQNGQLAVRFQFNSLGGKLFGDLTTKYAPDREDFKRQLAILLDNQIQSAPSINEPITGGSGQISGNFDRKEIEELVTVLNAGALDVPLKPMPISEFTISPLLGADVQTKGITAIVISALAVFAFMQIYYLKAGIIANLSLLLNLILVVGAMAFIEATFTLPGLAGLVLTIGMAVDSNVLIYERMREELARGASLRMAIQNGFDKAFSTIIDSNVTTLITAVILYLIGTDQIRGFAVSLFIGLMMSLFSVLIFCHLAFEIAERKRWFTSLKMMQVIGATNYDFLKNRMLAYTVSIVVIGIGLATLVVRGSDNMDIDFSGGTMVTFEFDKPQETSQVQAKLDEAFTPEVVSLEQLTLANEDQGQSGRRYRMRCTIQDTLEVRKKINDAFATPEFALRKVTLDYSALAKIEPPTDATKATTADLRFANGNATTISLSSGMREATLNEYVIEKLEAVKNDKDQQKYPNAQSLVQITGSKAVEAPVVDEKASAVVTPLFTEASLRATPDLAADDLNAALVALKEQMATSPVFDEVNSFDTSVSNETRRDAVIAVVLSLIAIVIYIWFRFEKVYFGLAAVTALAHDVLVTIGAIAVAAYLSRTPIGPLFAFEDFKVNMGLIASLLTIVGYSLNDTIVIFDRIREIKGKNPNITYDMINQSVNQTLSRTILTALTVLIVVVILYFAGGSGIHGFAFAMIVGVLTGSYSTVFIANPVLYMLVRREQGAAKTDSKLATA